MLISVEKIKGYVHDATCLIHDAVCLIYGFDPERMVIKNSHNYRDVTFRQSVTEFNALYKILRGNRLFWEIRDNIFCFVDKTLQNNISVDKELLSAISSYVENLINEDIKIFKKQFPYLMREIEPEQKETIPNFPIVTTSAERIEKWQEISHERWKQNSKIKKKDMAKSIYEILTQSDPKYITQLDGSFVSLATIEKNIKKR
ncbi:TPA: hypothetical protein ACPSKB_000810 [Legionella feeleii]